MGDLVIHVKYRECVHIGRNAAVHSGWFSSCTISNPAVHWLLMPAPWCLHVAVQHSWWGLVLAKMPGLYLVGERRRHLPPLLPKPRPPLELASAMWGVGTRLVMPSHNFSTINFCPLLTIFLNGPPEMCLCSEWLCITSLYVSSCITPHTQCGHL